MIGEDPLVTPLIVHVSFETEQLSFVVGFAGVTVATHAPASTSTGMLDGHVIVGAIRSLMVT